MKDIERARSLIIAGKYREATLLLDRLLRKEKENDELWYLRGILSLKLKNYNYAQECFERAVWIIQKAQYFKIMGMAHMELFELEEALADFKKALEHDPNDATVHFFIAICYLFTDDQRVGKHLQYAWRIDRKRTKQLLENFYSMFIKKDPGVNKKMKAEIEKELNKMA